MSDGKFSRIGRLGSAATPAQSRDDRDPEVGGGADGRTEPNAGPSIALEAAKKRHQATLAELSAEFDRRLAVLNAPDARARIEATLASRGRGIPRSKAGPSY